MATQLCRINMKKRSSMKPYLSEFVPCHHEGVILMKHKMVPMCDAQMPLRTAFNVCEECFMEQVKTRYDTMVCRSNVLKQLELLVEQYRNVHHHLCPGSFYATRRTIRIDSTLLPICKDCEPILYSIISLCSSIGYQGIDPRFEFNLGMRKRLDDIIIEIQHSIYAAKDKQLIHLMGFKKQS